MGKTVRNRNRPRSAKNVSGAGRRLGTKSPDTARGLRRWSQDVTEHSAALDLKEGVFTFDDPAKIAASLKRSAEHSKRRKADPYRSAMSMLTFYINRGGKGLSAARRRVLERAKDELRRQFGRA